MNLKYRKFLFRMILDTDLKYNELEFNISKKGSFLNYIQI